jgi:hypothetical protein
LNNRATNIIVTGNTILPADNVSTNFGVTFYYLDQVTFDNNVINGSAGAVNNDHSTFASIFNNHSTLGADVYPISHNSYFISPSDGLITKAGGPDGAMNVGAISTLGNGTFSAWLCASNSSGIIQKNLPLPNDYWAGKLQYVSSWKIRTTVPGFYSFEIGVQDILTNDLNDWQQQLVTFTAPSTTNTITVSATNSISTTNINCLQTYIYTGNQIQPGKFSILSGTVTAQ